MSSVTKDGKVLAWDTYAWRNRTPDRASPPIAGNRERDGTDIRRVSGADQMHGSSALAIHPAAVDGEERPGTIVLEPADWPGHDAGHGEHDSARCAEREDDATVLEQMVHPWPAPLRRALDRNNAQTRRAVTDTELDEKAKAIARAQHRHGRRALARQ